jgi:hypothetical protein
MYNWVARRICVGIKRVVEQAIIITSIVIFVKLLSISNAKKKILHFA